ncbi:hypothetical protein B0F90DRAFT_251629 [Multifurca ochricompacta]|uniref:WIBG Mago-binding domain-containing protein n=1 Tax=Multifurca ochricompacta TaxID=376703 RepID=A0AAD4QP43_9AGAM|nr:hypothetical protein B0F90DRAFT_251629 [Multifurca ochricompacta]
MSKPPLSPQQTASGIAINPRTLDRVIPESRRADGSLRKERRIRPGFTPQEDVARFRSSRQQAVDARTLPKGHIPGWVPPTASVPESKDQQSKSAKKNEKRREKRKEKHQDAVRESWDSEGEEGISAQPVGQEIPPLQLVDSNTPARGQHSEKVEQTVPEAASLESGVDAVADRLDKLSV